MAFTREQVTQLAPDTASAKAGQQFATPVKWVKLCAHDQALWGECKGSGTHPYKTQVDLVNIAFKCSCPSRKFPCKHVLGLMYLYTEKLQAFSKETTLPAEIESWIQKRGAKSEPKEAKPVDEKAQQKRIEAREKKVKAGIEELRFWIKDIVRTGIMNIPQQQYEFSKNITARMVDAQASGLAAQLRKLERINYFGQDWQKQLAKQLSLMYVLTEGYNKVQEEPFKHDLMNLIGWNPAKEEILKNTGIHDTWLVVSRSEEAEANLRVERVWLYGQNTKKVHCYLIS